MTVRRLTPRAAHDGVDGWDVDDKGRPVLKVRVRAAPVDGKANTALIAFLAKALDVPRSRITLVGGETARTKTLEIEGVDAAFLAKPTGPPDKTGRFGQTE